MKLFIWAGILSDYTDGIAFALAGSVEEARELIAKKYKDLEGCEISGLEEDPLVVEEPAGFYLWGGG